LGGGYYSLFAFVFMGQEKIKLFRDGCTNIYFLRPKLIANPNPLSPTPKISFSFFSF
jgi:hypothetical protein